MKRFHSFPHYFILIFTCVLLNTRVLSQRYRRQTEDFNEGGLPRHLPSPPEHPAAAVPATGGQILSQSAPDVPPTLDFTPPEMDFTNNVVLTGDDGGFYQFPYYFPQESMTTSTESEDVETTTAAADEEEEEEDDTPAPFGLDETILIIVPQFKYTLSGFPKWAGASVRLSLPITIFFDELHWPNTTAPAPLSLSTGFGSLLFNGNWMGKGSKRKSRSILSLPPPDSLRGGERATLIPKLEEMLGRFGIGAGRACLLRTVCEVHAAKVHRSYGFFGEFLTHVFSISHSMFAETHLASYLEAEGKGKNGNCSKYFKKCSYSLFENSQNRSTTQ